MEDQLIRKARRSFYLAWPLLAGMLISLLALTGGLSWTQAAAVIVPASALLAFLCQCSWHLSKALPLRVSKLSAPLFPQLTAAAVVSGLWVATVAGAGALLSAALPWEDLDQRLHDQLPMLFGVGVMYYLLVAAFHYVVLALQASREAEQREADARLLARESELKALKAQINPHFLFNSLHSISALTSVDAARARRMCILLSEFLRSTLGLGEKTRIRFSDELKLARQYLAVEQVRFGNRMQVEEVVEPESLGCLLPPLLLQPLVENAVKHGVATLTGTAKIRLGAGLSGGRLRIDLENQYDPEAAPKHPHGMGLRNVKERLHAAYDRGAEIHAGVSNGAWRVELLLPAQTEDRA